MTSPPTHDMVLRLLRHGSADERRAFVERLPDSSFKSVALPLVASDTPGMVVVGLGSLAQTYCYGAHPTIGAPLASALHDRAREVCEQTANHGLLPKTLSGLASSHLKALSLLGRNEELVPAAERYSALYRDEPENLPALQTLRIEALVNLQRFDAAEQALRATPALMSHPIQGIEVRRLARHVTSAKGSVFELPGERPSPAEPTQNQELSEVLRHVMSLGLSGAHGETARQLMEQLGGSPTLDPTSSDGFTRLGDLLDRGEAFLAGGQSESEMALAGKIRRASGIFVHGTPPRERILQSLSELTDALRWAQARGVQPLQNDAWWGIYLCHSRLNDSAAAADALIHLRDGLETRRAGIQDPTERAGIFGQYRYLFPALCEHLHKAGRYLDLLEAIESSKGRAIADRLAQEQQDLVPDSAIYDSVSRLPALAREHAFHYLSYFVDETCVYAVLVDKRGAVHAAPVLQLSQAQIRSATNAVAPERWGQLTPRRQRIPRTDHVLAPLVAWLSALLDQRVLACDDQLVFSVDDNLYNVPLGYLAFRDGILLQWFAVARVHSAFQLHHALSRSDGRPPQAFVGFVAPALQDAAEPGAEERLQAFLAPPAWLARRLPGESFVREQATLRAVKHATLQARIVHFSTHGWFPPDGNPFTGSYLLMAGPDGLPDKEGAAVDPGYPGRLTPAVALNMAITAHGSHVSTMACVSGLAREGVAGDTLGLDWVFLQAGATALLSSHWFVGAQPAARFFELFYDRWLNRHESRGQAVRCATLELLNADFSPANLQRWAAFSLTGDFR